MTGDTEFREWLDAVAPAWMSHPVSLPQVGTMVRTWFDLGRAWGERCARREAEALCNAALAAGLAECERLRGELARAELRMPCRVLRNGRQPAAPLFEHDAFGTGPDRCAACGEALADGDHVLRVATYRTMPAAGGSMVRCPTGRWESYHHRCAPPAKVLR